MAKSIKTITKQVTRLMAGAAPEAVAAEIGLRLRNQARELADNHRRAARTQCLDVLVHDLELYPTHWAAVAAGE